MLWLYQCLRVLFVVETRALLRAELYIVEVPQLVLLIDGAASRSRLHWIHIDLVVAEGRCLVQLGLVLNLHQDCPPWLFVCQVINILTFRQNVVFEPVLTGAGYHLLVFEDNVEHATNALGFGDAMRPWLGIQPNRWQTIPLDT
jgi:hypothetical protein